ncbi:hypothetical protein V6N12_019147 [Hibiscus sabdariffa]|uniref:Uncharacterized protein n=1 Tax=Hibiscus sabdariffa TaxID=183260 RepID=A0ABR2BBZ3_9ROSI
MGSQFKVLDGVHDDMHELLEVDPTLPISNIDARMQMDAGEPILLARSREDDVSADGSNSCLSTSPRVVLDLEGVGGSTPMVVVSVGEGDGIQVQSNLTKTKVGSHAALNIVDNEKLRRVAYSKKVALQDWVKEAVQGVDKLAKSVQENGQQAQGVNLSVSGDAVSRTEDGIRDSQ